MLEMPLGRVCVARHLLLQAMLATAMADDHVCDEEDATLRDVYQEVMRCSLDAGEVKQAAEEMRSAGIQVELDAITCCSWIYVVHIH